MFVGSQVRIAMEEDHFYPDLVFYNRLLKCFVIIDLKIGILVKCKLSTVNPTFFAKAPKEIYEIICK